MEEKKKKTSFIKVIKNIWDREGQKAEKKKANKTKVPSGYRSRQLGRVAFWVVFSCMFLFMVAVFFTNSSAEEKEDETFVYEQNQATTQAAVEYARDFTKEYFTWKRGDEGKNNRRDKISKFLAEGLNEDAGLDFDSLEWDANFKNADLKDIKENSDNRAYITFKVDVEMNKVVKEKSKSKKKKNKNVAKKSEKTEIVTQYMVVPVAYEGGWFGVYELPKFTNLEEETNINKYSPVGLKSYEGNTSEVKEFLETFFSTYASDDESKISYMVSDDNDIQGLNGSLNFEAIGDTNIYQNDLDEIVVFVEVKFSEPGTKVVFNTDYQLTLINKDNKFMINGMNDFVDKKQVNDLEVEDSEDNEDKEENN